MSAKVLLTEPAHLTVTAFKTDNDSKVADFPGAVQNCSHRHFPTARFSVGAGVPNA